MTMATDAEQPPADDAEEQVMHQLRQSVRKQKWTCLLKLCIEELSPVQTEWLFQQICDGDDPHLAKDLADKCPHEPLGQQQLGARRNCRAVRAALQRGDSLPLRMWVLEEYKRVASNDDFRFHVLDFWPEYKLHSVVKGWVERGQWRGVGDVLLSGTTDAIFITIVEAILTLPEPSLALLTVMIYTQKDRLIWALKELLTRASLDIDLAHDDLVLEWFVQQMVGKVKDEEVIKDYIVPLSPVGQSSWLCSHLAARGLWEAVALVVKKPVCSAVLCWALSPSPKSTHCVSDSKIKHGDVAVPQDGSKPEDFAWLRAMRCLTTRSRCRVKTTHRQQGQTQHRLQTQVTSNTMTLPCGDWWLTASCGQVVFPRYLSLVLRQIAQSGRTTSRHSVLG